MRGVGSGQPYTEYGDSDTEVGVTRYALSGVCHRFVRRGIATPTRRANGPPSRDSFPICSRWNAKSNATMPLRTGLYRLRKNVSLGPRYRYAATRTRIFRLLNRSPLPLSLSLSLSPFRFVLRGSATSASFRRADCYSIRRYSYLNFIFGG